MRKRMIAFLCAFIFMLVSVLGRIAYITLFNVYTVSDSYNSYTINISKKYTNIYSRDGELLNNNNKTLVAVIRPNEKCLSELKLLFSSEEVKEITNELSNGYPVVKSIEKYAKTNYIKIIETVKENDENMLCRHLLDKTCGGLETYTDDEIGSLNINFSVDAVGRILSGDDGKIINDNYDSDEGIIISIDKKLQSIAESSAENLKKGSVVILDASTSQVLASVSKGDDYLNRSLSAYAVGSIFKLVMCSAALENNINPVYTCNSYVKVGDTEFHCQNNKKHGTQTMKEALANSCNCYFVNLALEIGIDESIKALQQFGFCQGYELYGNYSVKAGTYPTKDILSQKGQLALLGFGQGKLTDSPLHFASVVACIANGGLYNFPTLELKKSANNRIVSRKTSETIKEYMRYVVENGTGNNAYYEGKTAGKTATAQSGVYNNGEEVLNTWFAGFYPYENPKYSIVVMCEDGTSGSQDCCPIFRTIVENIENM